MGSKVKGERIMSRPPKIGYGVWGARYGVKGIQPIAGHCVILNRSVERTVREGSLP